MTTPALTLNANKKTARIAGILYLLVGITGGFAEGFVEPKMYAGGTDAPTTALNVVNNVGLVRLGVVSDLIDQVFFVFLALTLYGLLRHAGQSVARAMVVLVILAAGIASLNVGFLFQGLQVATDPTYLEAFGQAGRDAIVLMLLDLQHYGLLIAQMFFGLWLAPLGYLAIKSKLFPKALGITLIVAAVCYVVHLLLAFLFPEVDGAVNGMIVIPCAVAEIWMVLYLLIIGVRTPKADNAISGAAMAVPAAA